MRIACMTSCSSPVQADNFFLFFKIIYEQSSPDSTHTIYVDHRKGKECIGNLTKHLSNVQVIYIYDCFSAFGPYDITKLIDFEKKYGETNLRVYGESLDSDNNPTINWQKKKLNELLFSHITFFETEFSKNSYSCLFLSHYSTVTQFTCVVASLVAQRAGITPVVTRDNGFWGILPFIDNIYGYSKDLDRIYNDYLPADLTDKEIDIADAIISKIKRGKLNRPRINQHLIAKQSWTKKIKLSGSIVKALAGDFNFKSAIFQINKLLSVLYDPPKMEYDFVKNKGMYVFLGLNNEPNPALDIWSPQYKNSLAVIENLAQSLPAGYDLIIKDHPKMKSKNRSIEFYKRIESMPNVYWVDPSYDSLGIIQNAAIVCCVNSAIGMDAFLWRKPVVFFSSRPAYFYFENTPVSMVTDFSKLPVVLNNLLGHEVPVDMVRKYVLSQLKSSINYSLYGEKSVDMIGTMLEPKTQNDIMKYILHNLIKTAKDHSLAS